jgi:hypothetical protein
MAISHVALGHLRWSMDRRAVGWSWIVGERLPMRVLKSPHTIDLCWGGMVAIISSISCLAVASGILRLVRDLVGGM